MSQPYCLSLNKLMITNFEIRYTIYIVILNTKGLRIMNELGICYETSPSLHQHPELSLHEFETTAYIKAF